MKLLDLKQDRKAGLDAADAIVTAAEKAGRDMTAEENTRFETLMSDVKRLDANIERIERVNTLRVGSFVEVLDGNGNGAANNRTPVETWKDERGRVVPVLKNDQSYARVMGAGAKPVGFSFGDFVKALVMPTDNPEIRAALDEAGGVSSGDVTVPVNLLPGLIDLMRAKTVCIQAGALTVPLDTEITNIARISADPTPAWRSENAAFAESAPTFEKVSFVPKSLGVLVKVSAELFEDSANIGTAINMAFAGALAVELDRVALLGTGVDPQPHGISGTSGVGSVDLGANGADLTDYDPFVDAVNALLTANAAMPTAAIMAPRTLTKLAKLKDTLNQPLRRPDLIANLPFLSTTSVPINQTHGTSNVASEIVAGDFTQLLFGVRHRLRIKVLTDRFWADNGQYGFVADLRADVQLRHPQSFCEVVGVL